MGSAGIVALLGALLAPVQVEEPREVPLPDRLVEEIHLDVAGRSVRALCTGGAPKVVFLHDAGGSAGDWRPVLEWLAPLVPACAYERTRLVGVEGEASERGWLELLEELLMVHRALGVDDGYVLVGHGEGGMYARLLAASRRGVPGGLVLVEPTHERLPRLIRPGLPEADWEEWMSRRVRPNADGVRPADLAERAQRTRLPGMPVTVITATHRPVEADWDVRFLDEAARRAHEELVRGRPFGRHVPAEGSGPRLPTDAPAVLVEEIQRVLRVAGSR